jgi:hypothetical protein
MEMVRSSSTSSEAREQLVGTRVWLEYFDQNSYFEEVFTPQYGTIIRQFDGGEGRDDWYLVKLEQPFGYMQFDVEHLVISSRWRGESVGQSTPTSIFVVLAPQPEKLTEPFEVDRDLFIAWGMTSQDKASIDKFFDRGSRTGKQDRGVT